MPRPPPRPADRLRMISNHLRELEGLLDKLGGGADLTEDARATLQLAEFSLLIGKTLVQHMVKPFPQEERFHWLIAPAFAPAGLFARRIAQALEVIDGTEDKSTKQRAIVSVVRHYAGMIADGVLRIDELPIGWSHITVPIVLQASILAGRGRFALGDADGEQLGQDEREQALARAAVEAWISDMREDLIWDQVNEFLEAFGLAANTPAADERAIWPKARQHKYTHPLAKLRIRIRRK
jgi:hypothetical protein